MFISPAKPRAVQAEAFAHQASRLGIEEQARRAALLRVPSSRGAELPHGPAQQPRPADHHLRRIG